MNIVLQYYTGSYLFIEAMLNSGELYKGQSEPGSGTLPQGLSDGLEDEPPPLRILADVQELAALRQPDLLLDDTQLENTF